MASSLPLDSLDDTNDAPIGSPTLFFYKRYDMDRNLANPHQSEVKSQMQQGVGEKGRFCEGKLVPHLPHTPSCLLLSN